MDSQNLAYYSSKTFLLILRKEIVNLCILKLVLLAGIILVYTTPFLCIFGTCLCSDFAKYEKSDDCCYCLNYSKGLTEDFCSCKNLSHSSFFWKNNNTLDVKIKYDFKYYINFKFRIISKIFDNVLLSKHPQKVSKVSTYLIFKCFLI